MEYEVIMKIDTIGVVGLGFVGTAVLRGMESTVNVVTYDIAKECTEKSIEDVVHKASVIFICVPTPMNSDGTCNIDIIHSVLTEIDAVKTENKPLCVIKSTVPPKTSFRFAHAFPHLTIAFNPEFLTERNYIEDFKNQPYIVLGYTIHKTSVIPLIDVYQERFPNTPIYVVESAEAEMIKYVANTMLATKVTFLNEIYQICEKAGINYDAIANILQTADSRLGHTHWNVPGPDGKFGFGGTCFPKDLNALIQFASLNGHFANFLNAVWEKNLEVRPEKDWELDKGRAVT